MKTILTFIIITLLTSCSVTQYHTAKTLKKGEKQFIIATDSYVSPTIQLYIQNNHPVQKKEYLIYMLPFYPALEFNWGTNKNKDRTIGLSIDGQLSYAVKYRLIGSDDSRFAMALRPEIGVFPISLTDQPQAWLKVPLIMTKDIGKKGSFTFSPGVTFSFPGVEYNQENQFIMLNSSFAFHYGKKNRVFIAYALQNINNSSFLISQQASIGYIFKFGKIK